MLQVALAAQSPHASDPGRVLAGLNQSLCGRFKHHYVTAMYAFVDLERNFMSYAGAGHPPLLLWRSSAGAVSEFLQNGLILGLFPGQSYSAVEIPIEPGDRALLYTDGILETESPSEQEFGLDLFKGFLESNRNLKADIFADSLLGELSSWSEHTNGEGRADDITLLAIDFHSH